jgi:hypothetical protein
VPTNVCFWRKNGHAADITAKTDFDPLQSSVGGGFGFPLQRKLDHFFDRTASSLRRQANDARGTARLANRPVTERSDDSGPVERTAQAAVPCRVNSEACSLTNSYMLIGFWPVSLNRSSVIRS